MKILVVSDSHRDFRSLLNAFKNNSDADMLIHLGDGENDINDLSDLYPVFPMVYVQGNCDYGFHETTHVVRTKQGVNIFCCHGHTFSVKSTLHLLTDEARFNNCDIALYDIVNGIYVMNPGSTSLPRGGSKPSYGVIEIGENRAVTMNIREL